MCKNSKDQIYFIHSPVLHVTFHKLKYFVEQAYMYIVDFYIR